MFLIHLLEYPFVDPAKGKVPVRYDFLNIKYIVVCKDNFNLGVEDDIATINILVEVHFLKRKN